jgi:hypothetical protein
MIDRPYREDCDGKICIKYQDKSVKYWRIACSESRHDGRLFSQIISWFSSVSLRKCFDGVSEQTTTAPFYAVPNSSFLNPRTEWTAYHPFIARPAKFPKLREQKYGARSCYGTVRNTPRPVRWPAMWSSASSQPPGCNWPQVGVQCILLLWAG